jgi:MFS family permease
VTEAASPRRSSSRFRSTLRALAVDLTPLRVSPDFRRIWTGLLISEFGSEFTLVATFVQVRRLTGSPAAVGLIGLSGLVALAASSIVSGAILDHYDRRKLLVSAQLGFMLSSGVLLAGAIAGHPPVWLIYLAVALSAAFSAIDSPTRSAMTPRLVGADLLPSALALNQIIWNFTGLIGPALAGIVIAGFGRFGPAWAYGIDLVTYVAMLVAAAGIRPMPPERSEGATVGWAAVKEGFAYLKGRRVIQSTFVIDIIAMVFGMPRALFTFLALTQFHGSDAVVGLLFSAPAVGAFVGAITSGWVGRVQHQGRAVIRAVVLWGVGITAFGLVGDHLWLALSFLAVAGGADVISAVFRSTILQLSVPDALRGRLSGIHLLVVSGGPRLGDLEAGIVAQAFTPTVSVVSGGLLCIAGAGVVAWLVPGFRRYRAGDPA